MQTRGTTGRGLAAVLALLSATGWAANHFAALLPVLRRTEHLSAALVAGLYGLYAVGLLPGLLAGGSLSDRFGRRAVALPGAAVAVLGTLTLLFFHHPAGLVVGRLVVGLGAGATFSAGTAWAGDLAGASGAARAGVFLTGGFAIGPVVSGLLAQFVPGPLTVPFVVSAVLSTAALTSAVAVPGGRRSPRANREHRGPGSVRVAFGWALPIAPWVFAGATVGLVTLPSRLPAADGGPLLTGIAAGTVLGVGILAQALARRGGDRPGHGALGAAAAAAGLALAGLGGSTPAVPLVVLAWLLLGAGYGLCLRAGLLDIGRFGPAARRGTLTGVFYLATYSGFAVPLLLEALRPVAGPRGPLFVLAGLAAAVGLTRARRLSRSP